MLAQLVGVLLSSWPVAGGPRWGLCVLVLLGVICATWSAVVAADLAMVDFQKGFDADKVTARDVKVALVKTDGGAALRLSTGHQQPWPGIDLVAPQGRWDLSPFLRVAIDVRNVGANGVTVCCRVDNPGADGVKNCITDQIALKPGGTGTLTVEIKRKGADPAGGKLFGMRGYPGGGQGEGAIDPANVTQLIVFVPQPSEDHAFEISQVRATGDYVAPKPLPAGTPFFPFIDAFGQYKHADWPGKVHSAQELVERLAEEDKDFAANPGPADWDQYGGWKSGPALQATGFFRTQKHDGKWWLVDPEGRLFISHGIDCVGELDLTPIDEREAWFEDFPGKQPEFQRFLGRGFSLHGHYAGKSPNGFTFGAANLFRKYGPQWRAQYAERAHRRLRSWGLNTIANWSDRSIYMLRKTPYVCTLGSGGKDLQGSSGYWGKFRDVFDPDFRAQTEPRMAQEAGKTAGDPWCIGYFVDNEMSWGDETSLALAALASPPEQAAKRAFLDDLKARYVAIERLNEAWGVQHASWEALRDSRTPPDKKRAAADLHAFYTRTADTYFKTVRDAVKAVAPKQLYLGCRFAWVNPLAAAAAARHCDVVSYNLYRKSVADFTFPGGADVPLIIGEFHFGALDRGMFHTGLVKTADQTERARTYQDYVQGMLWHPGFVGCHWFKYVDEPTTGRQYDEENYQIGFLSIVDEPYRETIAASRAVGAAMYRTRTGK